MHMVRGDADVYRSALICSASGPVHLFDDDGGDWFE